MEVLRAVALFTNIFSLVVGIICLLCGTIHLIVNKNHLNFLNNDILSMPTILLIYGFSLLTISSLGILGAVLRHTGVMRCYVMISVNILIVKAILCLWFYHCLEEVLEYLENNLRVGLQGFAKVGFEGVTETWNVVQHEFGCCGVTWYRDWESVIPETPGNTTWSSSPMLSSWSVPDSCCRSDVVGCGQNVVKMTTEKVAVILLYSNLISRIKRKRDSGEKENILRNGRNSINDGQMSYFHDP